MIRRLLHWLNGIGHGKSVPDPLTIRNEHDWDPRADENYHVEFNGK